MGNEENSYYAIKESKMKISKEVYDALVEWRDNHELNTNVVDRWDMFYLPLKVYSWTDTNRLSDNRKRLAAILQWLDGKDVFEIEKPKKWVVRSKETDEDGDYWYLLHTNYLGIDMAENKCGLDEITYFDTKQEAESWANAHQEVVEVEV